MIPRRLAVLAALLLAPLAAAAQTFPERSVRIVMPWPPGGGTDILGRAFAERLSREWNQPVVVDNRAGANGILGTLEAARARPDGYTLLMATADTHGINPAVRPGLAYDAVRDFVPVIWASTQPLILCVHPSLPVRDAREFVEYARARPGAVNVASWGSGSTAHMAAELFQLRTGTQLTHVPYRGAAPAIADLIAGQVQAIFTGPFAANQHHPAGRLRCLATATETRPVTAPDYPTFAESGFPGVLGGTWFGLVAPAGTPAPVLAVLRAATARALDTPEIQERIAGLGQDPVGGDPERFTEFMRAEVERWREVARAGNIVVE